MNKLYILIFFLSSFFATSQVQGGHSSIISEEEERLMYQAAPVLHEPPSISSDGFLLLWSPSSGATSYILDIAYNSSFTSYVSGYQNKSITGSGYGSQLAMVIAPLDGNTFYYCRLRAVGPGGTSSYSNVIQVPIDVASSPVPILHNPGQGYTGKTSFAAIWEPSSGATSYRLDVAYDPNFSSYVPGYHYKTVEGDNFYGDLKMYAVTNLRGLTTYYCRIWGMGPNGLSASSNIITVTTLVDIPDVPTAVSAIDITTESATLRWEDAHMADSYRLDVSTSSSFGSFVNGYEDRPVSGTSLSIDGLSTNTTYHYRVRAVNALGTSGNSNSISFTTINTPEKPVDWTFYYCKEDEISLTTYGYDHTLNWYENNQLVHTGINLDLPMRPKGVYHFFATNVNAEGYESEEAAKITLSIGGNNCVPPYNHVKTTTVLVPGKTDAAQIDGLPVGQKSVAITYYDGLGRAMQKVSWQVSPQKKDIVLPLIYDDAGRQARGYLPFVSTEDDGWYRPHYKLIDHITHDYIGEAASFYAPGSNNRVADDLRPFSETFFEASPLNRPLKSYGPGVDWFDQEKHVEYNYLINEDGIEQERIIAWVLNELGMPVRYKSTSFNGNSGYWPTGSLNISSVKDEEGMETREYRNSLGQVILKKVQLRREEPVDLGNPAHWVETYYLYDDYGNLRFVLAPELAKQMAQDAHAVPNAEDLDDFAFQYKYDARQRLIEKHVPGGGSTYMVYDKWDRLVLTQDEEQKLANEWSFVKYDASNRPIITGLYTDNRTSAAIQTALESATVRFESLNPQPGAASVYTNVSFPTNGIEPLTETYYDGYGFLGTTSWDAEGNDYSYQDDELPGIAKNERVLGQVTGGKVKVLGTGTWLNNVTYYDEYYNPIQSISEHHLGGVDRISSQYDFSGKILRTVYTHSGLEQHEIVLEHTYDHAGRLLETWHTTNNGDPVLLSKNGYNELGELVTKNLHKEGNAFAQSVDYRYNIRGWLKRINNSDLSPDEGDHKDDLFGMELSYEDGFEVPQYNGNISGARWKNAVDNTERAYGYTYDAMNRLTGADYVAGGPGGWEQEEERFEVGNIRYDHNGNILALDRNGLFRHTMGEAPEYGITDQLSYHYRGNQLMAVNDAMDTPEGNASDFRDNGSKGDLNNPEYDYDANGNMTRDGNKGITVTYNHLNLPKKVDFGGNKYIEYTYDATGTKLRQEVHDGEGPARRTDYVGGMVYRDGQLQFVQHGEGRTVMVDSDGLSKLPEYQYHLKDHLGNVRLTFSATPDIESETATLETAYGEEEHATFLRYAETTKINSALFDHTGNGDTHYAVRLNGSESERIGLARSLAVMTGDTVRAEVYAKYLDPDQNNWTAALQNLMAAIAAGTAPTGTVIEAVPPVGGDGFPFAGLLDAAKANDTGTRAYLNILLFDEALGFLDAAYVPVTTAAREDGTNIPHEKLSGEIVVQQPGYAYIYFSNDNDQPLEVFFDDFTVEHVHSAIVQADDYYPFGMTFNSYRRELGKLNEYLYQGKERSEALGWDDFHARMYSPALGRFFGVDPQDQFASPFIGMGNNPVVMIDPDGEWAFLIPVAIGAVVNTVSNWQHISSADNFLQGLGRAAGYAGVGALQGASTLVGGPAGYALSGAVGGLGNGLMQGLSEDALMANIGVGAASGLLGGIAAQGAGQLIGDIASPLLDGLAKGAVGGAAGGFVGGGVASSLMGGSFWDGAWQGTVQGAAYGAAIGGAVRSYKAYKDGFNPLTGKRIEGKVNNIQPLKPILPEDGRQIRLENTSNGKKMINLEIREINSKTVTSLELWNTMMEAVGGSPATIHTQNASYTNSNGIRWSYYKGGGYNKNGATIQGNYPKGNYPKSPFIKIRGR